MSSPRLQPMPRAGFVRSGIAHRVPIVATVLALAIAMLQGCAATTPTPVIAHPTASNSPAPGPCWLLNIEELTNNSNTLGRPDDSMQLVLTYRFGKSGHETGGELHPPLELASRTTRTRVDEWNDDHLHTHPTAICSPEGLQPPVQINGQVSPTN